MDGDHVPGNGRNVVADCFTAALMSYAMTSSLQTFHAILESITDSQMLAWLRTDVSSKRSKGQSLTCSSENNAPLETPDSFDAYLNKIKNFDDRASYMVLSRRHVPLEH